MNFIFAFSDVQILSTI